MVGASVAESLLVRPCLLPTLSLLLSLSPRVRFDKPHTGAVVPPFAPHTTTIFTRHGHQTLISYKSDQKTPLSAYKNLQRREQAGARRLDNTSEQKNWATALNE